MKRRLDPDVLLVWVGGPLAVVLFVVAGALAAGVTPW